MSCALQRGMGVLARLGLRGLSAEVAGDITITHTSHESRPGEDPI